MKVLKFFGWLWVPYFMLIASWKKLKLFPKILGIFWSVFTILVLIVAFSSETPTTNTAGDVEKQIDSVQSATSAEDEQTEPQVTWESKIKEIANSDQTEEEKFKQVEIELVYNYTPTEEEIESFENDIINAFKNGEYLKDITNSEYMLTNIFKSSVIVDSYEDKNDPMALFAFDFWQNSKYTYRGIDAVDSEAVKANEEQMQKSLDKM